MKQGKKRVSIFALCLLTVICGGATAQAQIVSDNFNRPDGDLGPNWTRPIASEYSLAVANDQVGVAVENSHNYAFWSAGSFSDDQYSQATITAIGPWTGLILRADGVLDRFYMGFVFGPNDYRIYARWDGAYYSLATGNSETWQVGDVLRLEVRGTSNPISITMYRNGHAVLTWTSSVPSQVRAGGSPGLGIYSPAGQHLTLDNWEGGTLTPDTQPPTAPDSLAATAVGATRINLAWPASTDNVGVSAYFVERQDTPNGNFAQIGTAPGTSFQDAGLTAATLHTYRIRATDAAGNLSPYSPLAAATTLSADSNSASDNFNRGDGSLGTNWAWPMDSQNHLVVINNQVGVAVENDYNYAYWNANGFNDDQYSQISITKMGSWPGVILRADGVQDRFYLGLLVGPNDYRIYSRWDGGYNLLAVGTTETWQLGDTLRMDVRGDTNPLTVTMYHNGNAVLSWTSANASQVKSGGSPGIGIYSPAGQHLTLDNWEGGSLAADTQPPTAPTTLTATAAGASQVNLSWAASTDNVGVSEYLVEREDPGSANFVQIGTAAATSFADGGLTPSSLYSYRVRATDAAGNQSSYSPVASATTLASNQGTFSDNFNRADGSLGSNWARPIASQNNLVIAGNQVGVDVENSHNYAYWTANGFNNDQYSQIGITKMGSWPGVILRADGVQDRFYLGLLVGPNDYRIYSRWDGGYNLLAIATSETWQIGDTLRMEVRGSANPVTVTMYHNGNAVLTWTSTDASQVKTGGSPGIGIYSPGGEHLTLDNWQGGSL